MSHKELCLALSRADTEKEVIKILKKAGYWNNPSAWRHYGDYENNFGQIGNQQNKADAALVEKIINSVDAILMRECLTKGMDPEGDEAPISTREALEKYFNIDNGKLSNVTATKRTQLGENIILISTGARSNPSYSVIDKGEGQTPQKMPETFLSLSKSNKLRIPFVQGKFNMGGTGALRFCGDNKMQLIISKRNPEISKYENDETAEYWGFTIVRRVTPEEGMKNSTFKYLAPNGNILMFKSDSLPILPGNYPNAFENNLEWGSYTKLYEYQLTGLKAPVYFDLYYRLSMLLPNVALPVLMCERRKGYTAASYNITMSGLSVRLDEDKRENLEPGFPNSSNITTNGQKMNLLIYAFKKGKRDRYSKNDGVIFTVNGQAHGFLPSTFFTRKAVGLNYLDDSILVIADCSEFDRETQEDLFMTSRDRLCDGDLKKQIEKELQELLKKHEGLRELKERRRREEMEGKIGDAKPLLETIEKILRNSPTLSQLFIKGIKLQNPFDLRGVKKAKTFTGKKHPTFFRITKDFTSAKPKKCHKNQRFRIYLETDVENEYFTRESFPGDFSLWIKDDPIDYISLNLWNGFATLTADLPKNADVNDLIRFECEIEDETLIDPFCDDFYIKVDSPQEISKIYNRVGERDPPGRTSGEDRNRPSSLALPNSIKIRRDEWEKYGFDRESALKIKYAGEGKGYDFYINVDNIHLLTEIKGRSKSNPKILEEQYVDGMILIGLALLSEFEKEDDPYKKISIITKAISPFLLPMIYTLGDLEMDN